MTRIADNAMPKFALDFTHICVTDYLCLKGYLTMKVTMCYITFSKVHLPCGCTDVAVYMFCEYFVTTHTPTLCSLKCFTCVHVIVNFIETVQ